MIFIIIINGMTYLALHQNWMMWKHTNCHTVMKKYFCQNVIWIWRSKKRLQCSLKNEKKQAKVCGNFIVIWSMFKLIDTEPNSMWNGIYSFQIPVAWLFSMHSDQKMSNLLAIYYTTCACANTTRTSSTLQQHYTKWFQVCLNTRMVFTTFFMWWFDSRLLVRTMQRMQWNIYWQVSWIDWWRSTQYECELDVMEKGDASKRMERHKESGTLSGLASTIATISPQFLRHSFVKRQQSEQFNKVDRQRASNVQFARFQRVL